MFPKPVSEASVRIADYTSKWILSGWRPSTNLAASRSQERRPTFAFLRA